MDVYGRLWMASRAGFEMVRKFLSALVVRASDEPNTPSDTPRLSARNFPSDSNAPRELLLTLLAVHKDLTIDRPQVFRFCGRPFQAQVRGAFQLDHDAIPSFVESHRSDLRGVDIPLVDLPDVELHPYVPTARSKPRTVRTPLPSRSTSLDGPQGMATKSAWNTTGTNPTCVRPGSLGLV